MQTYYDHESRSFLNTATYALAQIPSGAVKVTEELKAQLLEGERTGQVIALGPEGVPMLVEPEADPQAALNQERYWRDSEIERIKWLRERHRDELEMQLDNTLSHEQYAELLTYLQLLRDWPQSEQFPDIEHRPHLPAWIADQTP